MDLAGTHWNHCAAAAAWDVVMLRTAAGAAFDMLMLRAAAYISGHLTSANVTNSWVAGGLGPHLVLGAG